MLSFFVHKYHVNYLCIFKLYKVYISAAVLRIAHHICSDSGKRVSIDVLRTLNLRYNRNNNGVMNHKKATYCVKKLSQALR